MRASVENWFDVSHPHAVWNVLLVGQNKQWNAFKEVAAYHFICEIVKNKNIQN